MNDFPRLKDAAVRFDDARGYLEVLYESPSVVLKRSFSKKGVFRGLHVQDHSAPQVKLIRVVEGEIVDFVVSLRDPDRAIRHDRLKPGDGWVRIDAHFAHGFYALEDSLFEYICDGPYSEGAEMTLSIVDHVKALVGTDDLILSEKDRLATALTDGSA